MLGFFTSGGDGRPSPSVDASDDDNTSSSPHTKYFEISNSTSTACLQCIRLEARCDSLAPQALQACHEIINKIEIVDSLENCKVSTFIGATTPIDSPFIPGLAICSSVCTPPGGTGFPNYHVGYGRPYHQSHDLLSK